MTAESKAAPPDPAAIKAAREGAGLTQVEAAELVHAGERLWRYWESGAHRMPPGLFELFEIKLRQRQEGNA